MSYLTDLVVTKRKDGKYNYAVMGAFQSMNWFLTEHEKPEVRKKQVKKLNSQARTWFRKEPKVTTAELLSDVPVDAIIEVISDDDYRAMEHKPFDNNIWNLDVDAYLSGKVSKPEPEEIPQNIKVTE